MEHPRCEGDRDVMESCFLPEGIFPSRMRWKREILWIGPIAPAPKASSSPVLGEFGSLLGGTGFAGHLRSFARDPCSSLEDGRGGLKRPVMWAMGVESSESSKIMR